MRRYLVVTVAAALLATGCSSSDAPSDGTDGASPSTTTSAEESPQGRGLDADSGDTDSETKGDMRSSKDLPKGCEIGDDDIALFSRDWNRVAGAVGRPDLSEYTSDLAKNTEDLAARAEACPGARKAAALVLLALQIDAEAAEDTFDMDTINEFQIVGDVWLKALGYGDSTLPTG